MSGSVEVPGAGKMEVTSGKVVVTEWHAQGVGLVLSKEVLTKSLSADNGVEVVVSSESQTALTSWERTGSLPASPTPCSP